MVWPFEMPFFFGVTELNFGTAGSAGPKFLCFTVVWEDILFVQAVSPSFAQITRPPLVTQSWLNTGLFSLLGLAFLASPQRSAELLKCK